jgi:SAM-dependent methyltransferase
MNFEKRSTLPELLDDDQIPKADLFRNLRELETINTLLGGHAVSLKGLEQLVNKDEKILSVIDLGCGGGDLLYTIQRWAMRKGITVKLAGLDAKPEAFDYIRQRFPSLKDIDCYPVTFAQATEIVPEYDIAIAALVHHHLYHPDIEQLLRLMHSARRGFVINDLHRHPMAYYSIKWLTALLSKSVLVKHDAPLSVAKAFSKNELQALLHSVGIDRYHITWEWAFRWLVVAEAHPDGVE